MAERTNHKLLDQVRGMWFEVGTSHFIWTKVINICCLPNQSFANKKKSSSNFLLKTILNYTNI